MAFDVGRMRRGELVAAGGAVLLLVALFALPAFAVRSGGTLAVTGRAGMSLDGWQALTSTRWVLLITIVACVALVVLAVSQRAPAVPVTVALVSCLLGDLSSLLLLYRLIDHPGLTARSGIYLGLVGALAIGYGGYRTLRTEGSSFGDPRTIETVSMGRPRSDPAERTQSTSVPADRAVESN